MGRCQCSFIGFEIGRFANLRHKCIALVALLLAVPCYGQFSANDKENTDAPFAEESDVGSGQLFGPSDTDATHGSGAPPSVDGWIYHNAQAMQLVKEARKFDPLYCPAGQQDRDAAIERYIAAIDSQSGAPSNAVLADRIAQMYAFIEDREKGVVPDPAEAAVWWQRCAEMASSDKLLWAQSKMGMSSSNVMRKAPQNSIPHLKDILKVDADSVDLESWKHTFFTKDLAWREQERLRLKLELIALQEDARKTLGYLEKAIAAREKIQERKLTAAAIGSSGARWKWVLTLNSFVLLILGLAFIVRWRIQQRKVP